MNSLIPTLISRKQTIRRASLLSTNLNDRMAGRCTTLRTWP